MWRMRVVLVICMGAAVHAVWRPQVMMEPVLWAVVTAPWRTGFIVSVFNSTQ